MLLASEAHKIPYYQEIGGVVHLFYHVELVVKPFPYRTGNCFKVFLCPSVSQGSQVFIWIPFLGRKLERRDHRCAKFELEVAARGDNSCILNCFRHIGKQLHHLFVSAEVVAIAIEAQVVGISEFLICSDV